VFARSVGISLEQLRADNPALRPAVWEGNKRIPRGFPVKVRAAAVSSGDLLAMIPMDYKFAVQTPDVAYVVERGDSLSVIARRFDTTVSRLVALNQLRSRNRISIGQRLLLPQDNVDTSQMVVEAEATADGRYQVRRGDTVSLIAARFGVSEQEVLSLNGIADRNRIYPGQDLRLPGFESEGEQPTPTPPITLEESTTELALMDESLPPAAVLPDDQEMNSEVTTEEETAEAVDPELDDTEVAQQLVESLSADPSDYKVASNDTVEIQASETLGHFAEWLGIRAWDIRRLNNMAYRDPVIIGERLRLEFSSVTIAEFERERREFHSNMQRDFFASYRIQGVETYQVRRGDNIGAIARNRYSSPIWLIRQYNPELDFNRIQIGQSIVFPLLEQAN
jgi:membrane-bound lytic murein transglycosylase D